MNISLEDLRSGKVPLKFGDPDQIAVLEKERARQAAAEARAKTPDSKADAMVLKVYEIQVSGSFSATVSVEAYDEEEAIELAKAEPLEGLDYDIEDWDVEHVEPKK